jgi:hypothetical protein
VSGTSSAPGRAAGAVKDAASPSSGHGGRLAALYPDGLKLRLVERGYQLVSESKLQGDGFKGVLCIARQGQAQTTVQLLLFDDPRSAIALEEPYRPMKGVALARDGGTLLIVQGPNASAGLRALVE